MMESMRIVPTIEFRNGEFIFGGLVIRYDKRGLMVSAERVENFRARFEKGDRHETTRST